MYQISSKQTIYQGQGEVSIEMVYQMRQITKITAKASTRAITMGMMLIASGNTSLAACGATINGQPMTQEACDFARQVYGHVIPGDYLMDIYGNWVNINNPTHYGNTYRDNVRRKAQPSYGSSWGGGSYNSPKGVYDATGGCEGGSCVNIID